jgi:hypothetical protein
MDPVLIPPQSTANPVASAIAKLALTCVNQRPAAATQYQYLSGMKLLRRDADILTGVAAFGALTTAQVRALYFHELKSDSPCTTALRRLVAAGMLAKVTIRFPLKDRGAPMSCFQIGPNGWKSFYSKRFTPIRDQMKLMHTLAVADAHIATVQLERAGEIEILEYANEPDTWIELGGSELRPDMYHDLHLIKAKQRVVYWIEVEESRKSQPKLIKKLHAYKRAERDSGRYPGDKFPQVMVLATTPERLRDIRSALKKAKMPDGYVEVHMLESYPQFLLR